jgi:FtsZ-interacting cell division protein ZipA
MELWLIAVIVVVVVALAVMTLWVLRRRRAGTVLIVKADGRISRRRARAS